MSVKHASKASIPAAPGRGPDASTAAAQPPFRLSVLFELARRFFEPHLVRILFYLGLAIVAQSVLPVRVSLSLGQMTDAVTQRVSAPAGTGAPGHLLTDPLTWQFLAWGIQSVLLMGTVFLLRAYSSYLDGRITNEIRHATFSSALRQPPAFFAEHDPDRLTTIINQSSIQASMGLRQLLVDPVFQLFGIGFAGYTLYGQLERAMAHGGGAPRVWFAGILAFALVSPLLVALLGRTLQRVSADLQERNLALATLVGGAVKAPEEVQAMRAEPIFEGIYARLLDTLLQSRVRQTTTVEKLNLLNQFPGFVVQVALLAVAVFGIVQGGNARPGDLVKIVGIAPVFMASVQGLSNILVNRNMSWPSLWLINLIVSRCGKHGVEDRGSIEDMAEPTLAVEHVTFSFDGRRRILDDVSFTVPAGTICGLVARMGQGKTTFFRLLLRFHDPQSGRMLVGNVPHEDFSISALRRHVVLMAQFPAYFHDTIRQNFLFARPDATDAEIEALCRQTILWSVLEGAYGKSPLDQPFRAGARLSGGQKKLFALTRCLLRRPSILLLDEPTTGVDAVDKPLLGAMIKQACAGKTLVVVDHDIVWLARFCDTFVVLNNGQLVQHGSGSELLDQPGLFHELHRSASPDSNGASAPGPVAGVQALDQVAPAR